MGMGINKTLKPGGLVASSSVAKAEMAERLKF
jgi:hypothetical protein